MQRRKEVRDCGLVEAMGERERARDNEVKVGVGLGQEELIGLAWRN